MDLGRLRTLRELAVRQTMAAVADALLISPSAVSQQIALLEQEAGVQLIERRGRGVQLTAAGKHLLVRAERIIAEVEAAKADLAEFNKVVSGEVRLAAFPSVASALVPALFKSLHAEHPQLELVFEELEPAEAIAALRSWQVDAALIDDLNVPAGHVDPNLETVPVTEDVFHIMLPKRHRLAKQVSVKMKDLRDEPWAIDTASPTYMEMFNGLCRKSEFEPHIVAKCNGLEVTQSLVRSGCAVSITPGLRAGNALPGVAVRRLVPEIRRKIVLGLRKGELHHPKLKALASHVRAAAERIRLNRKNS